MQVGDAPSAGTAALFAILALGGCAGARAQPPSEKLAQPTASVVAAPEAPPEMIEVAGGTFLMGDEERAPPHRETVADFDMGRTEVTTAAYRRCVAAGACSTPVGMAPDEFPRNKACQEALVNECNFTRSDREEHPINCVTLAQAEAYCHWRGQRLPTEAEWELAARGTTGRKNPWGDSPWTTERANLCDERCLRVLHCPFPPASTKERDGYLTTSPVASYPKGETLLGIQDLLGNVWELTSTVDYGTPNLAPKARAPIARGSSWASGDDLGFRAQFSPAKGYPEVGFRCARDARNAEK